MINTICRINKESRQVVELRKWVLREEQNGKGTLRILDCLTGQDREAEMDSLCNPVNDKYYQYLFSNELETFRGWNCFLMSRPDRAAEFSMRTIIIMPWNR